LADPGGFVRGSVSALLQLHGNSIQQRKPNGRTF
jgi:hypothetical protein